MKFNQLQLSKFKARKRLGRGIAAGGGKTAGRGTKGQKSRSGGLVRPFFEGGQTPLIRRVPKLAGFVSHRRPTLVIYTGQLDQIKTNSKIIDNHALAQAGLIKHEFCKVKIITKGELKKAHTLHLQAISASALALVKAQGGTFKITPRPQRPASLKKTQRRQARLKLASKKSTKA